MSRQRMIQPGIWTDEGFLSISVPARLLFIGMISMADDEGRGLATDRCLKALVFPADDITLEKVRGLRDELAGNVNVKFYDVAGKHYYQLTKWRNHQRLERPKKSLIPPLPDASGTHPVSVTDVSGTRPAELDELEELGGGSAAARPKRAARAPKRPRTSSIAGFDLEHYEKTGELKEARG